MYFSVLGSWIRGLFSIAVIVAAVLLIREWTRELPRAERGHDPATGAETVRPLGGFGERLAEWDPGRDGGAGELAGGALLLLFAFGGRLVSPRLWRRSAPHRTRGPSRVHRGRTRNGYALHVEEYGREDAPAVVLVHGLGSDLSQWREAIEDLADGWRVLAYDLLGHGRSPRLPRAAHTLEAAARDLEDVIRLAGGAEGLVLAGHSMGGMIAMTWAARHPEEAGRLAGLLLVHTTPQDPFTTMTPPALHLALEKPVHEPLLRLTVPLAPVVRFTHALEYLNGMAHWSTAYTAFGGHETREQLDRMARLVLRMDPASVSRFALDLMSFDARRDLEGLHAPTIVMVAEKDPVTRPEAGRLIARLVPGARLVVLDDTRHMGFVERRRRFAEAVARLRPRDQRHAREHVAAR